MIDPRVRSTPGRFWRWRSWVEIAVGRQSGCATMRARRQWLALVVLAGSSVSCSARSDGSKPVYPVHGQVLFQGKPAPGALVLFHPVADPDPQVPRPHGRVDQESHFELSTYRANDGAPAGEYVVTIDWRQALPGHGGGGRNLLPPEYGTPKESPLRVTVRPATNRLAPFEIRR